MLQEFPFVKLISNLVESISLVKRLLNKKFLKKPFIRFYFLNYCNLRTGTTASSQQPLKNTQVDNSDCKTTQNEGAYTWGKSDLVYSWCGSPER